MRIPNDAIIASAKLTDYLLLPRPWDDKSRYLAQAGFSRMAPERLEEALRELNASTLAVPDGNNEYGEFFRQEGLLRGPNGRELPVTVIWLRRHSDRRFQFVTLKPRRRVVP